MKLTRYSKDVYQILDDAGAVAYLALRLANGNWGAYDRDERRVTRQTYLTPRQVLAYVSGRSALSKEPGDG